MPKAAPASIYQLKVTLKHIRPPIWRRIQVPADMLLSDLHVTLQEAMGWMDAHMHAFNIAGVEYFPDRESIAEFGGQLTGATRLKDTLDGEKASFTYEYDFGDGWEHVVLVEKVLPPEPGAALPRCLAGRRACPPEDCGGPWGYANLLEALADPEHEEHEDLKDWVGDDFDPEAFDLGAINERLTPRDRKRR